MNMICRGKRELAATQWFYWTYNPDYKFNKTMV